MITVVIQKQNQNITHINISGHAKSADAGKDLVCAGVSASSVGILNALVKHKFLEEDMGTLKMDNGYIDIVVKKITKEIQVILETLVIILETIQETNETFIEMKTMEV